MTRTREENAADLAFQAVENAASQLLSAVQALAWFLENSNEDDPHRTARFFRARETWRGAIAAADEAGITPMHSEPWDLIIGDEERNSEADWRYEVANGDTTLGLAEWKAHKDEAG